MDGQAYGIMNQDYGNNDNDQAETDRDYVPS
jgi:hypothetical protein